MSLDKSIKRAVAKQVKPKGPVWKGPSDPQGGITQSLLSRFLSCRERFRLLVVEGLKAEEGFSSRMEFGNLWHECEEGFASEISHFGEFVGTTAWEDNLREYGKKLAKKYPMQQDQVQHWFGVTKMMFPLYIKHWQEHQDVKDRTPLFQEQVFCVPYTLPSSRVVYLRGKFDSVDLIGKGKNAGIYLQENKTKQRIDEQKIKRQISWDMQVIFYLVALTEDQKTSMGFLGAHQDKSTGILTKKVKRGPPIPVAGIRYNCIRRSEHRVGKKETEKDFLERLKGIIEKSPDEWFMRWKVEVSPQDIARFRREFLDPILENLCEWWEWVSEPGFDPFGTAEGGATNYLHWRHPFGAESAIEGGWGLDLDNYMDTGSELGLSRITNLFPELKEV